MGRIVTGLFTSLDGVVDADDDWQFAWFDDELFAKITAGWARAAAVLVGRKSHEGYEGLRAEHPDSPVLGFLDATPTYVVSTTMTAPPRENVTVLAGDLEARVTTLRDDVAGDVLVLGSPSLLRWLIAHDLLDELNVLVLPVVVGSGPRLFTDMPAGRVPLRLVSAQPHANGALDLRYVPAR